MKRRNPYGDDEEVKDELEGSAGPLRMSELGAASHGSGQIYAEVRQRVKKQGLLH